MCIIRKPSDYWCKFGHWRLWSRIWAFIHLTTCCFNLLKYKSYSYKFDLYVSNYFFYLNIDLFYLTMFIVSCNILKPMAVLHLYSFNSILDTNKFLFDSNMGYFYLFNWKHFLSNLFLSNVCVQLLFAFDLHWKWRIESIIFACCVLAGYQTLNSSAKS